MAAADAARPRVRPYGTGRETQYLETVLANAPAYFGARFKVRNLGPGEKDAPLVRALELLERAMVIHRAQPTASYTLPLVARNDDERTTYDVLYETVTVQLAYTWVR